MDGYRKMKLYHYTGCGLDNVYLANGYTDHKTPYGRGVSIEDADGLHKEIARGIVLGSAPIRGQEVRFFRSLMDISQTGLGKILGVTRPTVARWEGQPNMAIPAVADRLLRLFYAMQQAGNKIALRVAELLRETDEIEHQTQKHRTVFRETQQGWQREAA